MPEPLRPLIVSLPKPALKTNCSPVLVVASMVFSWYLAEFDSYDRLYGSLGAVVGFMTWLWISIVVMLLGAEVDAKIESKSTGRSAAAPD